MAQPEIIKDIEARVKDTGDTMTGNLTAPTFIGTLDGNASSADKLNTNAGSLRQPIYFNNGKPVIAANNYVFYNEVSGATPPSGSSSFVLKIGDTMTGNLTAPTFIGKLQGNADTATALTSNAGSTGQAIYFAAGKPSAIDWHIGNSGVGEHNCNNIAYNFCGYYTSNGPATSIGATTADGAIWSQAYSTSWVAQIAQDYRDGDLFIRGKNNGTWTAWKRIWVTGDAVTSAVWNDYAEYREADIIESGYVLVETGDDTLTKSTERLSPFAGVSSDTWGFSQGETNKAKTPIAVAGRVLVYPWQDRNNYKPGDCVCAAPEGKVDIMTREEIIQYPDRIVGTVSSVPTYEKWGGGENADREPVDVNGRIWIKVK